MPKQDAIELLKTDHATVKKMFEKEGKLTKKDDEKKASLFNQIKAALEVHAAIEGNLLSRRQKGQIARCLLGVPVSFLVI